jgi:hypothetical protein
MQKVEGSSPFSRFKKRLEMRSFSDTQQEVEARVGGPFLRSVAD